MALDGGMRSDSYPWQSTPKKESPLLNKMEATRDPVLVWRVKQRNNIPSLTGIETQVCSFLIIMVIKSWLLTTKMKSIPVFWDVVPCGLVSQCIFELSATSLPKF